MTVSTLEKYHAARRELHRLIAVQEACHMFRDVDPVLAEQEIERTRALIPIMEKYLAELLKQFSALPCGRRTEEQ